MSLGPGVRPRRSAPLTLAGFDANRSLPALRGAVRRQHGTPGVDTAASMPRGGVSVFAPASTENAHNPILHGAP